MIGCRRERQPKDYNTKKKITKLINTNEKYLDYDVINIKKIFANGAEINLFSEVLLFDDKILFSAMSLKLESIIVRHLLNHQITEIQFLDNSENKGAALVIKFQPRNIFKTVFYMISSEDVKLFDSSCKSIVLTFPIPIENCDQNSISIIKKRLYKFCENSIKKVSIKTRTSSQLHLEIINFSVFQDCIVPFKLKAISCTSNKNYGSNYIFIIKDAYSIEESEIILNNYLLSKKRVSEEFLKEDNHVTSKNYKTLTNDIKGKIFESKNVETNGKYDVNVESFKSTFEKEWLHCDIIDTYLNEWRKRMGDIICNPLEKHFPRVKIYDTYLYTRLTRGVTFISSNDPDYERKFLKPLNENVQRIAGEKVYRFSSECLSIFDFNILIIPIHIEDHWITGVIYEPENCLITETQTDNDIMEVDDIYSTILVYDSLHCDQNYGKKFCYKVFKKYIEACYNILNKKLLNDKWLFDANRIRFAKIKNPYLQQNGYDCGLFMLEFIRKILMKPMLLKKLIDGHSMTNVFPHFNVDQSRNFLKSFVYSKVPFEKWAALREVEQDFLLKCYKIKKKYIRERSVEQKVNSSISKVSRRCKSCSF